MFQSTPPAEARGDRSRVLILTRVRGFNPLPPPKRGETAVVVVRRPSVEVSIHSPRRSEGRRDRRRHAVARRGAVSIHSPRRSEGRRPLLIRPTVLLEVSIHSPRRSEGRPGESGRCHLLNPKVSIHSPRRSEGRRGSRSMQKGNLWGFNPLPPPKRGETRPCLFPLCASPSFNPLPPPKRGETLSTSMSSPSQLVSIHSPRRSEGRRSLIRFSATT